MAVGCHTLTATLSICGLIGMSLEFGRTETTRAAGGCRKILSGTYACMIATMSEDLHKLIRFKFEREFLNMEVTAWVWEYTQTAHRSTVYDDRTVSLFMKLWEYQFIGYRPWILREPCKLFISESENEPWSFLYWLRTNNHTPSVRSDLWTLHGIASVSRREVLACT